MSSRRAAAVLIVLVTVTGVGACASEPERVSTSTVVQPGRPGEEATILPPGTTFGPAQDPWTEADALFLVQMIPHHAQAIEMAALAPGRAQDPVVVGMASRISDVQGAEMDVYRAWLSDHGMAEDGSEGSGAADHGSDHSMDGGSMGGGSMGGGSMEGMAGMAQMPGMATDDDLAALAASSGADFDRLWLELMTAHHQGALTMAAEREQGGGQNIRVGELAADVVVEQTDEIDRMQLLLAST